MCGLLGVYKKNEKHDIDIKQFSTALELMHHRGPDFGDIKLHDRFILGHRRLSIIDTSDNANQP
ncbi:MAG: hypothetical protein RDU14_15305 [Melioribacteraceae bacterium]|nr:hypothetical protein [Melioribacteraceae bacterium]